MINVHHRTAIDYRVNNKLILQSLVLNHRVILCAFSAKPVITLQQNEVYIYYLYVYEQVNVEVKPRCKI